MERKGNWFSNVKKALSPESKESKDQKSSKSKKKWFGKQKSQTSEPYLETDTAPPPPLAPPEEVVITHVENNEKNHDHVVEVATVVDAEVPTRAAPAVQTTIAEVQAASIVQFPTKPKDDVAAIKIQTAFRGYLARRGLRALRGLDRLKSLMDGPVVKRQATSTLRAMHTLGHVQSQIHSRRLRMLEENQALQKQLLQKQAKELETMRLGEEWDDSLQSKEEIEAKLLSKYEATMRRERALAYSFSHQQSWKNSSRSINPMFIDPANPNWGWSWLERWMSAHPWESHIQMEKDRTDNSSSKTCRMITSAEISKAFARFQLNSEKHSPTASQNPGSPNLQPHPNPPKPPSPAVAKKLNKASPKGSYAVDNDDTKSIASVQSGRMRRHSMDGSVIRDDESLASSPSVPSYMVPTKSAKAKSKMIQSPLAIATEDKGSFGSAKKQLSFSASPARPRRHSGPPKVETSFNAQVTVGNGVAV